MPAHAAIYLPYDNVDLSDLFEDARAVDGADGTTRFELELDGDAIGFNVLPPTELATHLAGFAGHIKTLDEPKGRLEDAATLVGHTKTVLGLVADCEFDDNAALWQCLLQVADRWDGFVFVYDSVVLPNGAVVVGPLKDR